MSLAAAAYRNVGKLSLSTSPCTLLVCDMQERFRPLIYEMPTVLNTCHYMTSVATALGLPIVVTQQYTKVFGPTIAEIFPSPEVQAATPVYEKKRFSMVTPEVQQVLHRPPTSSSLGPAPPARPAYLIVGIEAHVCVQQTCLDLLHEGQYDVHVIVDGVSSQRALDRSVALARLRDAGAFLTTAQSVAFMLLESADHPQFKVISQLTKRHMAGPNGF